MNVYIVKLLISYEGFIIEGVFETYEEAIKKAFEVKKDHEGYYDIQVLQFNTITQKTEVYNV